MIIMIMTIIIITIFSIVIMIVVMMMFGVWDNECPIAPLLHSPSHPSSELDVCPSANQGERNPGKMPTRNPNRSHLEILTFAERVKISRHPVNAQLLTSSIPREGLTLHVEHTHHGTIMANPNNSGTHYTISFNDIHIHMILNCLIDDDDDVLMTWNDQVG